MTHTHPHPHESGVSEHAHHHGTHEEDPHTHHSHSTDQRASQYGPSARSVVGKVAYFDCFAGASGDMLLGAMLDAGLPLDALEAELAKLHLDGYELEVEIKQDHGLTGTKLHVRDTLEAYPARHLGDIQSIVEKSSLSERVKRQSMAVFERLGRAEAGIHGVPLDEVHFHEVGAVDTIVDVVGFVAGLEWMGIEQAYSSPIPLGTGTTQIAHGRFPVPVPATLALIASVQAPTEPHPAQTEIVTPTGAALLTHLTIFDRPPMRVQAVGYGFGSKQFDWANGLRVWIGQRTGAPGFEHDEVIEMESNLDDTTGETLGYTMERLFEAGALDVWFTPIQMKKNRPGVMISVLAPSANVDDLALVLMRETSTLGVRLLPPSHRFKAHRVLRQVDTPWGKVQVKEKWLGDQRLSVSPEYEDCARLARESGEPMIHVMNVARQRAEQP